MKQSAIPALAVAIAALIVFAALDRDVTVAVAGVTIAVTAPPEIVGDYEQTETGWLVHGRAVIRAVTPQGTIREFVVRKGESKLLKLSESAGSMTLEIER